MKYVAVKMYDEISVHIPGNKTGNYYTLCGLDGADENPAVDQKTIDVPNGKKIDCDMCLAIWEMCQRYTKKDFAGTP